MSWSRGGRGAMTKTPITLQDLRRRLYVKAKAEPSWRFWGLYTHVCKPETLRAAYELAKQNDGAPGTDGVTFEAIEVDGVERCLDQLREELVQRSYRPQRPRKVGIPKEGERFASFRFRPFATGWPRVRSNSSWNRFSKPTFNRGRTATGRRSQRKRRSNASRTPSCRARPTSLTSTCDRTSIRCD